MSEFETLDEFERDGWHIEVAITPDYDYQPGRDDDIYPVLEELPRYYDTDDEARDYDGRFLPQPIIVDTRSGPAMVSVEAINRLIDIGWGEDATPSQRRRARKFIESDARAIGGEMLQWVGVRVRASRGDIVGEDSLWGVEYDLREREPDKYARETVEEAIERAARAAVGDLAPLALSY